LRWFLKSKAAGAKSLAGTVKSREPVKAVAHILVSFAPCFLASAVPFMQVFLGRTKGFKRPFFLCWLLFVFWMFFFSSVVPTMAFLFNRDLARTVQTDWVPEGPAVVAAAFMGWFMLPSPFCLRPLHGKWLPG
jgi:hypothetical protein